MATALALGSFGLGIYGSLQQKTEAKLQAQAGEYNAAVALEERKISIVSRNLERTKERKRAATFLSSQQAAYAKAGVTLSGSPLDVYRETATNLELDILIGDINASIEQSRLESEAATSGIQAENIERAGEVKSRITLLSSGLELGEKFIIPKSTSGANRYIA
jgi:hypothetical protein